MKKVLFVLVLFVKLNIIINDDLLAQETWRETLFTYIDSKLLKEDGGYGWSDQPDSHLTPTYAVIGILYMIDKLPNDKSRLAEFIKTNHPQKGPNREAGPSSSQMRDLTYQQIQSVLWLGGDASYFVDEVDAWKTQAGNKGNFEIHEFPGLYQEMMTPICRSLLDLSIDSKKSEFLSYLAACRRENGSFNNAPNTFGGDGNILNTYWSLKALQILDDGNDPLKEETGKWLQACQLVNGGFTHQPKPEIAPNDEVIYTWAAIKALKLLGKLPANANVKDYLLSLKNCDGGFGNRPGLPSTPMATFYALDALNTLDSFTSLDAAPIAKGATNQVKTDFTGYKVFSVQFEAHGNGSPSEAVKLAENLKIHLWGAKNSEEGWIEQAQSIADREKVPVTFFISSEPYNSNITVPGMGSFNHVLDYILQPGKDLLFEKNSTIQDFNNTTLEHLKSAKGGLILQVCNNEPLGRLLLDEGVRTNGYLAISTIHFGQNFLFWLPYLYQYRYQLPFITLQDAHGPESWWWSNELINHRTLFIAKEPSYDALILALKNNWVAAVRHDSLTNFKTRILGGTSEARDFIIGNEKSWNWWDGEINEKPWGIITVIDVHSRFEVGQPPEGINIRVRSSWKSERHILKSPITELVQLKVNGSVVNPELIEKFGKRGEKIDNYYQHKITHPSDQTYEIEATFLNLLTGESQTSNMIYEHN